MIENYFKIIKSLNPVLLFTGAVYTPSTSSTGFCVNVVIKETSGGGGGATTLTALTDVAITEPTEGEALTYNATTTKWENSVMLHRLYMQQQLGFLVAIIRCRVGNKKKWRKPLMILKHHGRWMKMISTG
jgi:hypothetical protein